LAEQSAKQANLRPTNQPYKFKKGDIVLLKRKPRAASDVPLKMLPEWIGPFRIDNMGDRVAYLKWISQPDIPPLRVHLDRIKPCYGHKVFDHEYYRSTLTPREAIADPEPEDEIEY
jgi:hypothetical protein